MAAGLVRVRVLTGSKRILRIGCRALVLIPEQREVKWLEGVGSGYDIATASECRSDLRSVVDLTVNWVNHEIRDTEILPRGRQSVRLVSDVWSSHRFRWVARVLHNDTNLGLLGQRSLRLGYSTGELGAVSAWLALTALVLLLRAVYGDLGSISAAYIRLRAEIDRVGWIIARNRSVRANNLLARVLNLAVYGHDTEVIDLVCGGATCEREFSGCWL